MEQEVTSRNTKNQILDAYNKLLKKVQEQKSQEPKKIQEEKQNLELTQKAKMLNNEGIVKEVAALKVNFSASLDKLGDQFISEYNKFEELQKAINIERKNLEELYELSASTDSLAVMLMAQKEQKEQFEQEMAQQKEELSESIKREKEQHETDMKEKRALWKKEQEERILAEKEALENRKRDRNREEEEYLYNLKLNRKKEADIYEEKKQKLERELNERRTAFEKEFQERKTAIEEAEAELNQLRIQNAEFPKELKEAVDAAVKSAADKLMAEHKFEIQLRDKETAGELKLKEQTITTLISKIKEMENAMKEMSQKTAIAESSVKDIAIKAIESSSKPYYFEKHKESSSVEK